MNRFATVTVAIWFLFSSPCLIAEPDKPAASLLHVNRQAETDLEVSGDLAGLPPRSPRFVAYNDLLAFPQVTYTVSDDSNFKAGTRISGIPLTELDRLLGAAG